MRGGDYAERAAARLSVADRHNLSLFQGSQQFHLNRQRNVARFVKKHRSAVGQLQQALTGEIGAGEGAADVAEQFALDQRRVQAARFTETSGPAASCEWRWIARATSLLARATLAGNQHRGAAVGATSAIRLKTSCIAGLAPINSSCSASAASASVSTTMRRAGAA